MFEGYLEWSGTELVNVERTEAYVAHLFPSVLQPQGNRGTLHIVTGEQGYRTPLMDAAPWANRFDSSTNEFYGFYPTAIQGIGSSTYAATTTQSAGDGGSTQTGRSSTRDVKVSGLLVASTEMGAETGLTWLRSALQTADCDDQCGGYLRYFLTEPAVCELAWGAENGVTGDARFGSLDFSDKRIVYRWTKVDVDPTMPARARWSASAGEGVQLEYGALDASGGKLFSKTVFPLRVNYVPNPTFQTNVGGFTGPLEWVFSGGVDDGAFARLSPSSGAYGSGAYGAGTYAAAAISDRWATPAGTVTVSLAVRGAGDPVEVSMVDATTGLQVASLVVGAGLDWSRVAVTGVTNGTILNISSNAQVDIDQILAEYTATPLDYFDGSATLVDSVSAWAGAPDASISTVKPVGPMELTADDSDFEPYFRVLAGHVSNLRLTWWYRTAIDVGTQLRPIDRSLHNVSVTQGPQIVQRLDSTRTGGGYLIQVEFLFSAGNPFSYGPPVPVTTVPLVSAGFADPTVITELDDDWLYDPSALVPTAPPAAPSILADAVNPSITSWQRYYVEIPAEDVADWASSVPLLTINTLDAPVRQVRVRFHPNPFGYQAAQVDPTAYCADFLVSYLPARSTLLMNGITQSALASKSGAASVPADSILYGSDGGPMSWPHLSCGIAYVMTLDVPAPDDYALFEVELLLLREE